MVERHEVDKLRGILIVSITNVFDDYVCDVLHLILVVPERIEKLHILSGKWRFHALHHVVAIIAALAANIYSSKPIDRSIGVLLGRRGYGHKASHMLTSGIGFEFRLCLDPVGAFFGDCTLG